MDEEEEEEFGFVQPSMIKQLQSILSLYSDDGQILKELLQNAEDAEATKICFLYDETRFGRNPDKLLHQDLATHQGPALYVYNDAEFTKKDWDGIGKLYDSVKVDDPLKVGRFGLGFKSVLHVTDLPIALSGDTLGFIDPMEKYFTFGNRPCTGKKFNLRKAEHVKRLQEKHDQIAPFMGLFDCNEETFKAGGYKGTLFRFPLRSMPSELSNTVYSKERVLDLFESFMNEAKHTLVFLKNITCVEFYTRSLNGNITKLHEAYVDDSTLTDARKISIERLKDAIKSLIQNNADHWRKEATAVSYPLTVKTSITPSKTGTIEKETSNWFIMQRLAGQEINKKFKDLCKDERCRVPLVGVAIPIAGKKSNEPLALGQWQPTQATGQLFCFLPLPFEKKSSTGLPVHLNGYFSVGQDRRHLQWSSIGQQDISRDNDVMWNHFLITDMIPQVYIDAVSQLISEIKEGRLEACPSSVIQALPDYKQVDENWKCILDTLFSRLLQHDELFFAYLDQKLQWMKADQCIFVCSETVQNAQLRELICTVMQKCKKPLIYLPDHLSEMAKRHLRHGTYKNVNPQAVRDALRSHEAAYDNLQADQKLMLLEYVIKDEDICDLVGLKLLPTADGKFVVFSDNPEKVFIETSEHPRCLTRNLEHKFVMAGLTQSVTEALKKLAQIGGTQVRMNSKKFMVKLIQDSVPKAWIDHSAPVLVSRGTQDYKWLESVWHYLRREWPANLSKFKGLPLLVVEQNKVLHVIQLSKPSTCILVDGKCPSILVEALQILGATITCSVVDFIECHSAAKDYVRTFDYNNILALLVELHTSDSRNFMQVLVDMTQEMKRELCSYISKSERATLKKHAKFLKDLPIFPVLSTNDNGQTKHVSITSVKRIAPSVLPPADLLKCSYELLNIEEPSVRSMALNTLGATQVTLSQLIRESAPHVDADHLERLVEFIKDNLAQLQGEDSDICKFVGTLQFLTNNGVPLKPMDLFDPEDTQVQAIFYKEDRFPTGRYADPKWLHFLRMCGLKKSDDVQGCHIETSVRQINDIVCTSPEVMSGIEQKLHAIFDHLEKKPQLLGYCVNDRPLQNILKNIAWIPVLKERPAGYPSCLKLQGQSHCGEFAAPKDICNLEHVFLMGAVELVSRINIPPAVAKALEIDSSRCFPVSKLIEQLKCLTQSYDAAKKAEFILMATKLYDAIQQDATGEMQMKMHGLTDWVWNGDGFSSPEHLCREELPFELKPYCCRLPEEMFSYVDLFSASGLNINRNNDLLIDILRKIKAEHDNEGPRRNVMRDLRLCVDILTYLKNQPEMERQKYRKSLLIPVQIPGRLVLHSISECVYYDREWLRKDELDLTFGSDVKVIHTDVSMDTAEALGVPSMMSHMREHLDFDVEDYGQSETLTDRLKEILSEYTLYDYTETADRTVVFQELIQNADDAGASVVKIMYDERNNLEYRQHLLDEGLKDWQGPALWVYNDVKFSEKDFANLKRLGGATKENDLMKIGKFGLGFNSVYSLTDVPSFVSGTDFVVLDPHATHMGKKCKPGIRFNTARNLALTKNIPHQFEPFKGVFGCHIGADGQDEFGTMFRLPLRTSEQAERSQICKMHYDRSDILEMFAELVSGGSDLLLFTNNVQRLELYHMGRSPSTNPEKLYEVSKSVKMSSGSETITVGRVLRDVKSFVKDSSQYHDFTIVTDFSTTVTEACKALCPAVSGPPNNSHEQWLQSFTLKHSQAGTPYVGAVATPVSADHTVVPVSSIGKVFCYLPLPIASKLPVHVHGNFALHSNRRHLVQHTGDGKSNDYGDWNSVLFRDVLCQAYRNLVNAGATMASDNRVDQSMISLWPNRASEQMNTLMEAFYSEVTNGKVPLMVAHGNIVLWNDAVFLSSDLLKESEMAANVITATRPNERIVKLPADVQEQLRSTGFQKCLDQKIYTFTGICRVLVLPNLCKLHKNADLAKARNYFVRWALEHDSEQLQGKECIPTQPDGRLRRPAELVDPLSELKILYDESDEVFPEDYFADPKWLGMLVQLGMKKTFDHIDWSDIINRAKSVEKLSQSHPDDTVDPVVRATKLLDVIEKKIKTKSDTDISYIKEELRKTKFLPIKKMQKIALPCMQTNENFASAESSYPASKMNLVSHAFCIVDINYEIQRFFGMLEKPVEPDIVINQWRAIIETYQKQSEDINKCNTYLEILTRALEDVMKYLNTVCEESETTQQKIKNMNDMLCLVIDNTLLKPNQVVYQNAHKCMPYIYEVPKHDKVSKEKIYKTLGVREYCTAEMCITALQDMYRKQTNNQEAENSEKLALNLVFSLADCLGDDQSVDYVCQTYGILYCPNEKGRLCPSTELYYNSLPWQYASRGLSDDFSHKHIPHEVASKLAIKKTSDSLLDECSLGMDFGQSEDLTNSLRRITEHYSCDHEVLKELIQNADDAGATEISFIVDGCNHPDEKIFDEKWKPLQGPALLVYNDKPFTKDDLENIQKVGDRTKIVDPTKTGQYGIGFCATYHLTDAPVILTQSESLGKRLCVLDPNLMFVPGATPNKPGRMFDVKDAFHDTYPDIFQCFHEEQFPPKNATMLRFALRTKETADKSKISNTPFTVEDLKCQMKLLKGELTKILLFTRSITKISIYENDHHGKPTLQYSASSAMQNDDQTKHDEFCSKIKEVGQKIKMRKTERFQLDDANQETVEYKVVITDTYGTQVWQIAQVLGFQEETEVPEVVQTAYDAGDIALMPLGGVAYLLQSSPRNLLYTPMTAHAAATRNISCFLPLPMHLNLPEGIHINGHFALAYENRRQVCNSDDKEYKYCWNKLLVALIAQAYVAMLCQLRDITDAKVTNLLLSKTQMPANTVQQISFADLISSLVSGYFEAFPEVNDNKGDIWELLMLAVYRQIHKSQERLLPYSATETVAIEWLPSHGDGSEKVYIAPKELEEDSSNDNGYRTNQSVQSEAMREKLKIRRDTMKRIGMKLISLCQHVKDGFAIADLSLMEASPAVVTEFLLHYQDAESQCTLPILPACIENTSFGDSQHFRSVVSYCKKYMTSLDTVEGLPLALTADNQLREFSKAAPLFPPDFSFLFPKNKHSFLKSEFCKIDCKKDAVFQELTTKKFRELLVMEYPDLVSETEIIGNPIQHSAVLSSIWEFLLRKVPVTVDGDNTSYSNEVKKFLINESFSNICIIPAKMGHTVYLFPLSKANCVFSGSIETQSQKSSAKTSLDPKRRRQIHLETSVRDLMLYSQNIPIYDSLFLDLKTTLSYSIGLLVATVNNPVGLVELLHHTNTKTGLNLDCNGCKHILRYLASYSSKLTENCKTWLYRLPVFKTVCGNVVSVDGCAVYTLPDGICTSRLDYFRDAKDTVFLAQNEEITSIYQFLGFHEKDEIDVYIDFILPQFELFFDDKAILDHLVYLYDKYFYCKSENQICWRLVNALKTTCMLKDMQGNKRCASELYNPENEVFKVFIDDRNFTDCTDFHDKTDMITFLKILGLKWDIDAQTVIQFAEKVVRISRNNAAQAERMSTLLITHISKMDFWKELERLKISNIPFIPCDKTYPYSVASVGFYKSKDLYDRQFASLVSGVAPLLTKDVQASIRSSFYQQTIKKALACLKNPPVLEVVRNLRTVCLSYDEKYKHALYDMYGWLEKEAAEEDLQELRNVPCILVNNSKEFATPFQCCLDILDDEQIPGYLYKIPPELGQFQKLFIKMSIPRRPLFIQYNNMLARLSECRHLMPRQIVQASKAVRNMFLILQGHANGQEDKTCCMDKMYLLSGKGNTKLSKDLVFNDAPAHYARVKEHKLDFLVDLSECGLTSMPARDLVALITHSNRPKMLSSIVSEEFTSAGKPDQYHRLAVMVHDLLTCEQFSDALTRLAQNDGIGMEKFHRYISDLKATKVYVLPALETKLLIGGKHVRDSKQTKALMYKNVDNGNRTFHWEIYMHEEQAAGISQTLAFWLTKALGAIVEGSLARSELYIQSLLMCQPEQMEAYLDSFNIIQNASQATSKQAIVPVPGKPISEHFKQSLSAVTAGESLQKGDYVACQTDSGDFVYGIVVGFPYYGTYEVNIGRNAYKTFYEILKFDE